MGVIREDRGRVARLTLNRPEALNALSMAMLRELQEALNALAEDPEIRVVVIAAAGRAFCAGHDLAELRAAREAPDGGAAKLKALFDTCSALMQTLPRLPQPVIAEVSGLATAAGCQLVASCDLAVAAQGTRFGVNGVNIGLFCSTPMVALTRNIARKQAFEMLVTGDFVEAERARELGLINRVVAPDDLARETMGMAEEIAAKLSTAVRVGKRAFYAQLEMGLAEAYAHTGEVIVANMMTEDTTEGVAAFLEKRAPDWAE
ncbi:MAG: enoyl-CoA hydratase [Pseudomonadota bacterium]